MRTLHKTPRGGSAALVPEACEEEPCPIGQSTAAHSPLGRTRQEAPKASPDHPLQRPPPKSALNPLTLPHPKQELFLGMPSLPSRWQESLFLTQGGLGQEFCTKEQEASPPLPWKWLFLGG